MDAMTPAVLVLAGPVARDEAAELCEKVRALLEDTRAGVVVCDVGGLGPPGLGVVGLLARLRAPDPALPGLLDLAGLSFEAERQFEQRKPAPGVEEAVESDDPAL
ncbi:hypothetical protein GCM10009549_31180 [Streptomyces thermoalcalitolerans]|uniref:STAS domain-containing protein n=2 Tax=Streptomyces thermoalcalitolerans TaxID=65605 RepID=A0ABN1NTM7_9ACTN